LRAFFLIAAAILLMVLDRRVAGFASIRASLSLPVATIQYIVNFPTQLAHNLKVTFSSHDDLVKENMKLKTDQLTLQAQLQRLIAIETENNYLKSLMQSSKTIKGKSLIAEVLAVDSEPFMNQIVINKGTTDGVYVGQPVLDATGLMGQITQAGPITSRLLLITSPQSGVAVQNVRNGMRAIAMGDSYTGKLRLMYVPKTADIKEGDAFITSGLGDHYPEGYPVGRVESVIKDPNQQFATIALLPNARLDSSREVLLVWVAKQ
jgi:rod shape-determining protein MreC